MVIWEKNNYQINYNKTIKLLMIHNYKNRYKILIQKYEKNKMDNKIFQKLKINACF